MTNILGASLPVRGEDFGKALCEIMNLDPNKITRMTMFIAPGQAVELNVVFVVNGKQGMGRRSVTRAQSGAILEVAKRFKLAPRSADAVNVDNVQPLREEQRTSD